MCAKPGPRSGNRLCRARCRPVPGPRPLVLGTDPMVIRAWLPSTVRPSVMVTSTPSSVRVTDSARAFLNSWTPRSANDSSRTARGVGVLVGQHPVPAGGHRHLHAQLGVGVHELGTGDPRAHHDEMFGQRLQVVELAPGQDALAVRLGRRQYPRAGPGGDQHHVGVVFTGASRRAPGGPDAVAGQAGAGVDQLAAAGDHFDTHAAQLSGDVGRLLGGQPLDAGMDLRQRDLGVFDSRSRTPAAARGAARCADRWRR